MLVLRVSGRLAASCSEKHWRGANGYGSGTWLKAFSSTSLLWVSYFATLGESPRMPFLLMLHRASALLVRIAVVPVNIKPYLKGPGHCWVQEVCWDWPAAFAELPFEWMLFALVGVEEHGCAFSFFAASQPPHSVFSPLMSVFVTSNTFQLAQWCIAPNILA